MKIRLWVLGDLKNGVIPTTSAIDKLTKLLENMSENGVNDLVWGPDLKCYLIDDETGTINKTE